MTETIISINRFALPLLALGLIVICLPRLLRRRQLRAKPSVFLFNTANRDKLSLTRFENSVGRSKHCDIVLNYPAVSRFHAVIARRRDGWLIIDTGSSGGTTLDGQPVEKRAALRHGQKLNFGSFDFIFWDEEEETRIEKEAARGGRMDTRF